MSPHLEHRKTHWRAVGLACALGFAVIALLVAAGWTTAIDRMVLERVGAIRNPGRTDAMIAVTLLGWGYITIPIGLALAGWLWYRRRPACAKLYLIAGFSGWALHATLKAAFQRPRPSVISRLDGAGWWAFPSGHAMLAPLVFGLAAILLAEQCQCRNRAALLLAIGWAIALGIGTSRVYLGVHYPSDVVAGLLAGTAWMAGALHYLRRRQPT